MGTSRATFTNNQCNDIHALNCRPKAQDCDRAMSSLTQQMWIDYNQKLRGHKAPGCK